MSADPKIPLDEAREALARVDAACAKYGWSADDGVSSEHLRAALAEVDRLTAENGRLREALTALDREIVGPNDARWSSIFGLDITFKGKVGDYAEATRNRAQAVFRRVLADVTRGQ